MPTVFRPNHAKIATLLHVLDKAAPWLILVSCLLILFVFLMGRARIKKAMLDFPVGEGLLGLGLFLQVLALTGVWGASHFPQ